MHTGHAANLSNWSEPLRRFKGHQIAVIPRQIRDGQGPKGKGQRANGKGKTRLIFRVRLSQKTRNLGVEECYFVLFFIGILSASLSGCITYVTENGTKDAPRVSVQYDPYDYQNDRFADAAKRSMRSQRVQIWRARGQLSQHPSGSLVAYVF